MSLKMPVKYPAKYYSYLDAGAPQLADVDGCIKTILKACLITGYGDKTGAGWEMPFEDDYRMVLRRPLKTGNPPDIKIENGIINGVASHRIVSYAMNSCTGLDDANEITSVNLLARNKHFTENWHMLVTDFGLVLFYGMSENTYRKDGNAMLYVGSVKKMQDADADYFICRKHTKVGSDGIGQPWLQPIFSSSENFVNLKTLEIYRENQVLSFNQDEKFLNDDFSAQPITLDEKMLLPFFTSLSDSVSDYETYKVIIDNRPMLRTVETYYNYRTLNRAVYIPLDYWEL